MKKFEIVKTTAEISWKERNEIKEDLKRIELR